MYYSSSVSDLAGRINLPLPIFIFPIKNKTIQKDRPNVDLSTKREVRGEG